jgi:Glutathione S-transferase, C-terminal domain
VTDLRNKIVSLVYSPTGGDPETAKSSIASFYGNLKKLTAMRDLNVSKGNVGPFLVGSAATVADFNLW